MAETFGQCFEIEASAATSPGTRFDWGTGVAYTGNEANTFRPRVRRVTISNDDSSITVTYQLNSSSAAVAHTLKAGETITHECISDSLTVISASGTPAFRAYGEG